VPSATYTLFRNAILAEQQVACIYDGRRRELCPHIIGTNKAGEEVVLAWQFAGESSGPLPQWRCLRLAGVTQARARAGAWYEGGSHRTTQTCVSAIDLDINIDVRPHRTPPRQRPQTPAAPPPVERRRRRRPRSRRNE
jgi:hypothetical protein